MPKCREVVSKMSNIVVINHASTMPDLPDTVTFLQLYNTDIERIERFPEGLTTLKIYGNKVLTALPDLPPRLQHLQLSHLPMLEYIPTLPDTVTNVELNNLDKIRKLPTITRGYVYLEDMVSLEYLPDPTHTEIAVFNCPALKNDEWKQFHAMR